MRLSGWALIVGGILLLAAIAQAAAYAPYVEREWNESERMLTALEQLWLQSSRVLRTTWVILGPLAVTMLILGGDLLRRTARDG